MLLLCSEFMSKYAVRLKAASCPGCASRNATYEPLLGAADPRVLTAALQFRSISNALYGSEQHHALVRDTVVRYMAANKAEFEPYLGEDWRRYINDMATDGTWGDELTLVRPRPATTLVATSADCWQEWGRTHAAAPCPPCAEQQLQLMCHV